MGAWVPDDYTATNPAPDIGLWTTLCFLICKVSSNTGSERHTEVGTLFRVKADEGGFASEADAEGPAHRRGGLGVGHFHEVDVTVGGAGHGNTDRL